MTGSLMDYLEKIREDGRNDPGYILDLVPDSIEAIHGNYASFGPSHPPINQAANQIINALIGIAIDVGADLETSQASNRKLHDEYMDGQDNLHRAGPGTALIGLERQRQRSVEGYDETHDDGHEFGRMALIAAEYLDEYIGTPPEGRDARFSQLIKAGAMIAAEIDRLMRKRESEIE